MMNSLLDTMFIKRFCLPSNTNIEKYENCEGKISPCICNHYNHIACVFEGKKSGLDKARILHFGTNMMGDIDGTTPGIHAEHNALSKLKPIKYKKRLEQINILVIRVSKTNKIQSSKPCNNCIKIILNAASTCLIISTTMSSLSALRKFNIFFNVVSNSSNEIDGMDWIRFLSSSLVLNGVGEE